MDPSSSFGSPVPIYFNMPQKKGQYFNMPQNKGQYNSAYQLFFLPRVMSKSFVSSNLTTHATENAKVLRAKYQPLSLAPIIHQTYCFFTTPKVTQLSVPKY